ncbi:MAG: acyltransferase [Terriglobia bacterium]|nr:acyltransferase [Terriglobia bacterium]
MKGRIPTLDGLRAVAISIVITSHIAWQNTALGRLGHLGVLIFFALSGYLITARLLDEYAANGRISLRNFYLRRAFRILPPALTYLSIVSLLAAVGLVVCNAAAIRGALLFYVNYIDVGDTGHRVGHFWSLSVEEHFYMLWPIALITFGVSKGWRTALMLTAAVIGWRALDHHFDILAGLFRDPHLAWNRYGTDAIADTLLWGCALAFFRFKLRPWVSLSTAGAAMVLLLLLTLDKLRIDANIAFTAQDLLPAVILGAIVSCPQSAVGRVLELRGMRFVGQLSYSLYIWQQIFLVGSKLAPVVGIAAAFACAYLSYRYIEQPFIGLGKRVILRFNLNGLARPA